jgi:type I restriction enzyme M protein
MLDTATKKRIDDCRDILVGKLPDPKAQIEQITIGLIYKFMDDMDKEAIELGGKAKFFQNYKLLDAEFPSDRKKDKVILFEQYRWDNLLDSKVTASEMLRLYSEAIVGMDKNPNIPQLFRDIFKNAYLPYRDPETLKLFLKTISEFEYTHSEKLGDAFEYLLSVMGSQGDAGQFRTPRHIIDFLVAIVNPAKTDTILDPACGTAGFLISAFKHIKHQNKNELTPDERKKLIRNFIGYDISPDMVRLSLVNLYLHGFSDPHIHEYDTLSSEERWNESYDVILANPPFMSPKGGIRPHKKFSIDSNRSEVLFVDYIAEHLNPKGKAGIIVPEGVIFQSGTAYKELRKMLLKNYLYAVVSLPAGVFNPYSGVKTSMLLMDKEVAKKRNEILFIKIDNDGYNLGAQRAAVKGSQLKEAIELAHAFVQTGEHKESLIAHTVLKITIAKSGDYNLSGERYKAGSILDSHFEMIELSDEAIFRIVSGGTPSSAIEEYWNGEINWATLADLPQNDFITKISSTTRQISEKGLKDSSAKLLPINSILVSTRATIGRIAINAVECSTNQGFKNIIITDFNRADAMFVALMMTKLIDKMNSMATGGTFKELSTTSFKTLQIPLPPLSVQQEIVAEIAGYQKIIDGAKAVVKNYKPKIDIDPEWEIVEFEKAPFEIIDGDRGNNYPNGDDFSSEGYCLFLNTKNVRENGFRFNDLMFITKEKDESLRKGKLQREDVLLTTRGTIGNTAYYDNSVPFKNVRINSGMLIFRPDNSILLSNYLFYFFQSENCQSQFKLIVSGAAQPQLPIRSLKSALIPLPEIEVQHKIVTQLEKEQALVNASKQLIEIFEQKIKDRITKVWGK